MNENHQSITSCHCPPPSEHSRESLRHLPQTPRSALFPTFEHAILLSHCCPFLVAFCQLRQPSSPFQPLFLPFPPPFFLTLSPTPARLLEVICHCLRAIEARQLHVRYEVLFLFQEFLERSKVRVFGFITTIRFFHHRNRRFGQRPVL